MRHKASRARTLVCFTLLSTRACYYISGLAAHRSSVLLGHQSREMSTVATLPGICRIAAPDSMEGWHIWSVQLRRLSLHRNKSDDTVIHAVSGSTLKEFAESRILTQPPRLNFPPIHGRAILLSANYKSFYLVLSSRIIIITSSSLVACPPVPRLCLFIPASMVWCSHNLLGCHTAVLLLVVWRQRLAFRPVRLPSSARLPPVIASLSGSIA